MGKVAILLSRQKLYPSLSNAWVKSSIEAVRWVSEHHHTLITSIGMQTWELLLYLGTYFNINQCIIVPSTDQESFNKKCFWIKSNFSVSDTTTCYKAIYSDTREAVSKLRDKVILEYSDIILPVSIRKNGEMSSILYDAQHIGKSIITDFLVDYEHKTAPIKYSFSNEDINKDLVDVGEKYLIHWTRGSLTSWPNETRDTYYSSIISSLNYPRTAFDTLKNIVQTRFIIGSSLHIVKNQVVVSFTGCTPVQFIPLMRWRSRYKCMSFEPFGIGIAKDYALKNGVRKVIYSDRNSTSSSVECWYFQSKGKVGNWEMEDEYRYNGNLDLSEISSSELICFCLYEYQAEVIQRLSGIKTISFQGKED